jgi:cell division protease FtsH
MIYLIFSIVFRSGFNEREVPYSQFLKQVQTGQVKQATISSERIQYQLKQDRPEAKAPRSLETIPIAVDENLIELLQNHEVEFSVAPSNDLSWLGFLGWLLWPLIFIGLGSLMLQRAQGEAGGTSVFSFGKSKARIYAEGDTGVTFDDVAGVDEAKAELQEIVDFLKNAEKYTRLGAKIPKGVLLVGPPGTGKTLLAKAIAGEANVPFLSISGSEFIELFVGIGASRVRDLFEQAKEQAPCIVFIDELDALGKSRLGQGAVFGRGNDEQEQTLNQLLNEMDGFNTNTGVVILAATNRPEVLDPALQRPGRFDRKIVVDRPDKNGRLAILQVHVPQIKMSEEVDLEKIAARTPGFSGADLANLVNEAALLAARRNADVVTMADFQEAIERVIAGVEKTSRILSEEEKKTVAYHETGHAIVGSLIPRAGKVEKISIVPRGFGALGYTLQLPEEEHFIVGEDEIRGRLAILLAGRSSEELIFGKVSTGASDDIQKVTELAERFVTIYGMSEKLGPIAFDKPQQQFLEGSGYFRRSLSPKVTEIIDQEVKALVEEAHQIALKILTLNRAVLEETAQKLLQEEVLEAQALRKQLDAVESPRGLDQWLLTGKSPEDRAQHSGISVRNQPHS